MNLSIHDPLGLRLVRRRPAAGRRLGHMRPANPKNRRRRCSLLVERAGPGGVTRVLVDASVRTCASSYSMPTRTGSTACCARHEHADHIHGIDDLRGLFIRQPPAGRPLCDGAHGGVSCRSASAIASCAPGSDTIRRSAICAALKAGRAADDRREGRPDHRAAVPAGPRRHDGARLSVR